MKLPVSRRTFCAAAAAAAAAACAALLPMTASHAQGAAWPTKPVTLVVPYPAGGPSDVIARAINGALGRQLGQPVIVENLGGASGSIAAQKVLSASADGHVMFLGSPNELILAPMVNAAIRVKAEDFRMVHAVAVAPMVLVTRKDLPVSNADELITLARRQPLTYGSVGIGSLYHLMTEQLGQSTGAQVTHVPYKGGAPLLQELGGGSIDFAILPFGAQIAPMAEQGRLKILGSTNIVRPETLKNLPTVNEGKLIRDFDYTTWAAVFVRKETPEEVTRKIAQALQAALADPAVRAALEAQRQIVPAASPLPDTARFYATETTRFRALAKSINLQAQ